MGNTISFPFLSPTEQQETSLLQNSVVSEQINTLKLMQKQISHLKEEYSYLRIDEQLKEPSIQQKILELENHIKNKICYDLPNPF